MTTKEFIKQFVEVAKDKIAYLQKLSQLTNEEKKARLDGYLVEFAEKGLNQLPLGIVSKWAIKKFIIANIPTITQMIFDLLKAKFDEVVK